MHSMNGMFDTYLGTLGFSILLFLFILAIFWFLLRLIFSTKDKLAALITESQKINAELLHIKKELSAMHAEIAKQRQSSIPPGDND